jgi:hypothetical protein
MRMYRRLIVSIAATAAVLAATPAFGQSFQQTTNPPHRLCSGSRTRVSGSASTSAAPGAVSSTDTNLGDINFDGGSGIVAGIFFGGNRDGRAGLQGEVSYLTKKVNFNATDGEDTLDVDSKEQVHPDSGSASHQHRFAQQQRSLPVLPGGSRRSTSRSAKAQNSQTSSAIRTMSIRALSTG